MTRNRPSRAPGADRQISWDDALTPLATLLAGNARSEVVDVLMAGGGADAFQRLRRAMQKHTFQSPSATFELHRGIDALDSQSRAEGLHVLHGWDFKVQRRPADIAPVLLLDYATRTGVPADCLRQAVAILLDEYCLALLALFAVRVWDTDDANASLDRLNGLVNELGGPGGSGRRVVDDVGMLVILAVAYYHPEERAYDDLLGRVRTLSPRHALAVALPTAPVMASHLRWGFRFMYRQDIGRMRSDNVVDYPWSQYALLTLLRAYAAAGSGYTQQDPTPRAVLADAIVNGLSPDPEAFVGKPPAFLAPYSRDYEELRSLLIRHRDGILVDAAALMPTPRSFSPMSFGCNFLSNAAVASATIALPGGEGNPSLNALFRHHGCGTDMNTRTEAFAKQLMTYSSDPARLGSGGAPLLVYDPFDGVHHYNAVVRAFQGAN